MTTWRKSSYSEANTPDCVEIAELDGVVGIRDSKHWERGHLTVSGEGFRSLVERARSGDLDRKQGC
jgi:hypothetical protein